MAQTAVHSTGHSDLISSLSFSSHGTRLATSSLDHSIRVASLTPSTGQWDAQPSAEFKAHDAPVLKVVWASPEFGPILASGGVDGVVKVWSEEDAPRIGAAGAPLPSATSSAAAGAGANKKRWIQKAALTDARGTVRDLEFCPPEFGLKLAAISSDSHLRLWECLDPVSLADWSLIEDIDLSVLPTTPSSNATTTPSGLQGDSLGLGAGVAAMDGSSPAKLGAAGGASGSGTVLGTSLASSSTGSAASSFDGRKAGTVESDGGWALSWCKEAWWGEHLAVSAGSSGLIRLFHLPDHAPWSNYLNLFPSSRSSTLNTISPVSSLVWAPASGRSYQLLASGSRDGKARVWKLYPPSLDGEGESGESGRWKGELDAELDDGVKTGSVGGVKVDWNVTGTVLSTAGDDAKVRLWKSTYTGQWRTIAVISTEETGDDDAGK
ncbi:WD40 repeat-like protein [Meredithblackwellia eburnea MCA 4105]